MIRTLDKNVRSLLRSQIVVSNLTQCIDELVVNSLDAGATCIVVRVDTTALHIQVADNGTGISRDSLHNLGERYATSKCHSLSDLNDVKCYGFRGEALSSIREISGRLEIITRHKSSYKTYCKTFRDGHAVGIKESETPRSDVGTTVNVHNLFSLLPVRRRLAFQLLDFERIRQRLACIALINPGISFSLFNDETGQNILQTRKSQTIISTFSQLFGNNSYKVKSFKEVNLDCGDVAVYGYIGTETYHSKTFQFIYINKRLLLNTKIHKLINRILKRSLLINKSACIKDDDIAAVSNCPRSDRYGVFIINLKCPVMTYDITLEPSKTLVEFDNWDRVLAVIKACMEDFLKKNFLFISPETVGGRYNSQNSESDCPIDLSDYEYQAEGSDYEPIHPSNCKKSLQSSLVCRKPKNRVDKKLKVKGNTMCTNEEEIQQPDLTELVGLNFEINEESRNHHFPSVHKKQSTSQHKSYFTSPNPITLKLREPFQSSNDVDSLAGSTIHQKCASKIVNDSIINESQIEGKEKEFVSDKQSSSCFTSDPSVTKGMQNISNERTSDKEMTHDYNDSMIKTQYSDICDEQLDLIMNEYEGKKNMATHTKEGQDTSLPWQLKYDNILKKNVYYNILTGNTVFDSPVNSQCCKEAHFVKTMPLVSAPHVSFNCAPWLPREKRKHEEVLADGTEKKVKPNSLITSMFENWENPVFEMPSELNISNLSKPAVVTNSLHKAILPFQFTKDIVKGLHFINQVDNKFIICQVNTISSKHDSLLVVLDQHAVHERIRLEKLIQGFFITCKSDSASPIIESSPSSLPIPLEIEFTPNELLFIKRYRSELKRIGIHFVVGSALETSDDSSTITVHKLPTVLVEQEMLVNQRPSEARSIVKEVIQSHIEHLNNSSGVSPSIPKIVLQILASKACHGAIKFGDPLTRPECEELLKKLSNCELPFQCAHGRPSIVPLVDLNMVQSRDQLFKVTHKPNLSKVTKMLNADLNVKHTDSL